MRNSLLAAIQRKVPSAPPPAEPEPKPQTADQTEPRRKEPRVVMVADKPKRRKGKQVQFWFHEEDGRLVRELAAWLAGQGLRPTDSLVIRAALRTAQTGAGLLQAYRRAAELDGRLKRHKLK
jgi:hypothetical protein